MQRRRGSGFVWAIAALLILSACATSQTDRIVQDRGTLPSQASVTAVPFFPQDDLYCGPASLAMVLTWSGLSVTQTDIAPMVYTPGREGTLPADMLAAARRSGRLAVPVQSLDDMLAEIAGGHPVVVFQNLALDWFPQWHFAVAKGYDLDTRDLILHSGLIADHRTALRTFEHTWRRADYWAMVVLPPDRLPVRADELSVLRAAAGLERVQRPADAATAYAAMLQRWPDSLGAAIGLGNARYAGRDIAGAEAAFRLAVERHPGSPVSWNNFAHVLSLRGRREEAIAAAQQAVRLGNGAENYRATLEEVSNPKTGN